MFDGDIEWKAGVPAEERGVSKGLGIRIGRGSSMGLVKPRSAGHLCRLRNGESIYCLLCNKPAQQCDKYYYHYLPVEKWMLRRGKQFA